MDDDHDPILLPPLQEFHLERYLNHVSLLKSLQQIGHPISTSITTIITTIKSIKLIIK